MTSKEFIYRFRKRLESGPDFFNPDTTLLPKERFDSAKCRILICFPTPHSNKTISSTAAALNDHIIEHCPDCFIDFAYMPENSDVALYDQYNLPYAIGNITHLDASHFDIVGFSISVLSDIVSTPVMLRSFDRCDKPIPLFWSDRKELPLKDCPIVYAGGITAAYSDLLFGDVNVKGVLKSAFLDFLYLGECDKQDILFSRYIEAKETGKVSRKQSDHFVPGCKEEELADFEEVLTVSTVQDFIEANFDCKWVYHPQAYEVKFNKSRRIISNKKINPKAQDFVTPYYPHILPDDLGIGRTIINANGDLAGTSQTQVSNGCSASGACSFSVHSDSRLWTNKGLVKISLANSLGVNTVAGASIKESFKSINKTNVGNVFTVQTVDGYRLKCDYRHKFLVVRYNRIVEAYTYDLLPGDVILRRVSCLNPGTFVNEVLAELMGSLQTHMYFGTGGKFYCRPKPTESIYLNRYLKYLDISLYGDFENIEWCFGEESPLVYGESLIVPERIFQASVSSKLSYLKGIFSAPIVDSKISAIVSGYEFANDLLLLISSCGLTAYVKKAFSGKYKISIYGKSACDFAKHLGFSEEVYSKFVCFNHGYLELDSSLSCQVRDFMSSADAKALGIYSIWSGKSECVSDRVYQNLPDNIVIQNDSPAKLLKSGEFVSDKIKSIISKGEVAEFYDVVATESSWCVYDSFLTHNCAEGNYCGGWVEKTKERILDECWQSKKYSAGYKYKPFSFNTNYLTDYKGMLREFRKIYPKVSFINMRMEELGRDLEAIRMMKYIGSNRMAAPVEGFSPRIQNNLLNKCLSQESLTSFMEELVHAKMLDIKVGGIYTGYEEDEDFQWMYDFVKSIKDKAADEGGNFPFRMNCTPLVHYPLTPIEYLERKTAWRSYEQIRWFTDEWYDKYREINMRIKMHGFRFSTYVEQSLVDLGRCLTPMIYKHFVEPLRPVYTLRSIVTPEFVEDLNNFIDPEAHFADRDPEHYISPCHRIRIELFGSYVPRARRLLRYKKEGRVFDNPPDIRCLKTYDGAKVQCQKNCIADEPLKVFSDVEFDSNGELTGSYTLLNGCERCQSNEQRKARLARPIVSTCDLDSLVATPAIPRVQKIRFVISRNEDYDVLNPNNTSHTFISKFLQESDRLLHAYHSIAVHNMFWQSEPIFKYFCSGYQIVDTFWSENVISEVKSLIPVVNSKMKSLQIISAEDILRDENLVINDINVFYFECKDIPKEVFESALLHYHGEIKVDAGTDASLVLETIQDKNLKPPVFVHKGRVLGVFAIPLKYNPLAYMSGFLSTVKRYGFDAVAESFTFKCLMTMRETSAVCKNCGKEKALISLVTSKPMPFGSDCLCKALLTQVVKGNS